MSTPWQDIGVGDIVIGSDGDQWRVDAIDYVDALVTLQRRDGTTWSGRPASSHVQRVQANGEAIQAEHQAAQAIKERFNAVTLGPGGWTLPKPEAYPHPGVFQTHLWIFHGDPLAHLGNDIRALVAAHGAMPHDPERGGKDYVHHTHR